MPSFQPIRADARVYVAGHTGLVGSAVWDHLDSLGYQDLLGWRSAEVDLRRRDDAYDAVTSSRPDVVILAAAKVGGILANSQDPVDFLHDNLRIQVNVMEAAHAADVDRLLFLGSSCIYPKFATQPISEDQLLTGALEPTNQTYAIAKITGILAVQAYRSQFGRNWISAMPTNLYGPRDNFDLNSSHVLPAMLRKYHDAKRAGGEVTLWGTGAPRREFLHVADLARAVVFLLEAYNADSTINVGTGSDISIKELAALVSDVVGFQGRTVWDSTKPDGTPRKLLDVSRLRALGWEPTLGLQDGVAKTYDWYLKSGRSDTSGSG